MDDTGRHHRHMSGGNEQRVKKFFRTACEWLWLPYHVMVDVKIIKKP